MAYSNFDIGKIRSYDNFVGEIVSQKGTYMFTNKDLSTEEEININDTVIFRGENVQNIKKAFFIRKIDLTKNLNSEIEQKIKKLKNNNL